MDDRSIRRPKARVLPSVLKCSKNELGRPAAGPAAAEPLGGPVRCPWATGRFGVDRRGGKSLSPRLKGVDNALRYPPHATPPFCHETKTHSGFLETGRREGGSKRESLALGAGRHLFGSFPLGLAVGRSVALRARTRWRTPEKPRSQVPPAPPRSRLSPLGGATEGSRSSAYADHPEPGTAWPWTCRGGNRGGFTLGRLGA